MPHSHLKQLIANKLTDLLNLDTPFNLEEADGEYFFETLNISNCYQLLNKDISYQIGPHSSSRELWFTVYLQDTPSIIAEKLGIDITSTNAIELNTNEIDPFSLAATKKDFRTAIRNKKSSVIQQLINRHPYLIHTYFSYGYSEYSEFKKPIHIAAALGHLEIFNLLASHEEVDVNEGEKGNNNGNTALMIAIKKGHHDIALALINDKRIDINKQNKKGHTALDYAILEQREKSDGTQPDFTLIKTLLNFDGLDINHVDIDGHTTLRSLFFQYNGEDIYEKCKYHKEVEERILALLLAHPNIDVNIKDEDLNTPLHIALSKITHIPSLKLLLNHPDIKINEKNKNGYSPLHLIVKRTGLTCFEDNSDNNLRESISSFSEYVALYGSRYVPSETYVSNPTVETHNEEAVAEEIASLLVAKGADINLATGKFCFETFLPYKKSCRSDAPPILMTTNLNILKLLIDKGANAQLAFLHFNKIQNKFLSMPNNFSSDKVINSCIKTELSRLAQAIDYLLELIPDPFKDKGSLGQLRGTLALDYFDEIEKDISFEEQRERYREILNHKADLSHHPEESRILRNFLCGKGPELTQRGHLAYPYNDEINNVFDAIRYTLIRQQTFSTDKKERYISPKILQIGFKRVIENRIKELDQLELEQKQKHAACIIQSRVRMHRFLPPANKLVNEHKQVKTFIEQYEQEVKNLTVKEKDNVQLQRIKFVSEKAEKYKVALQSEKKIQAGIDKMLTFFKKDSSVKVNQAVKMMKTMQTSLDSSETYRKHFGKR